MRIVTADITGSLIVNNIDVTETIESSSIWSGSLASRVTSLEQFSSSIDTIYATDAAVSASILVLSQSVQVSQASLSSSYTATSASLITTSASFAARLTTNETNFTNNSASNASRLNKIETTGYATTGSNQFTGSQYISNTDNATGFIAAAALYTDGGLRVAKDSYVSGTAYFNNMVVYGTSSIQYTTSSQVVVGASIINLNTQAPAVRYGGIAVADSGSSFGLTGSLLWDGLRDRWIYSNPSGSNYDGGLLISGPRNSTGLGNEQGTLNNYVTKGQGADHITSSQIIDDGTTVQIPGNLQITGSLSVSSFAILISGSNLVNGSVTNAKLANSTISGISLGSNLATLTIGTGLSGTSYNGSGAVTIANTITNNNQLTNGAGYITSTGTAAAVSQNITAGSESNLVSATIGTNDFFRIRGGGSSNAGFVEIATADDGTEPIFVRQYTGEFTSLTRTATILDGSGNTSFPGALSSTSATFTNSITVSSANTTGNGIILADDGDIVDLNDGYCSMRFSLGVRVFSGNRGGSAAIRLGNGGDIVASNDITAYGSPSDIRLKENIKPLELALDKVLKLEGVTYDWKEGTDARDMVNLKEDIGFIAQQVQEVVPELVRQNDNGLLSLRDRGITALLVEAIKEQQKQIEELKSIINGITK